MKKADNIIALQWIFRRGIKVLVLNNTFNNISYIPWRAVSLVGETRVPGENHQPVASHWQTLSHNVVLLSSYLKSADHASYKDDLLSWHDLKGLFF